MPTHPLNTTLPGTWGLLSRIDVTASGERLDEPSLGSDPIALLVFDRGGHFAAQFMRRDRSVPSPESAPEASGSNNTRALGGYDAYFGIYSINDQDGTVTTTLLAALSPESVGQQYIRGMAVDGDTLTITVKTTSQGQSITRTLTWRRVD